MVRLSAGAWEAELLPGHGGALATLRHAGANILRPTPSGASDPLQTASFALVPYANRIAFGRFAFRGRGICLPANFGDHPHPLHGVGWKSQWSVAHAADSHAQLRLEHEGDRHWPWAFVAEQRFALSERGLEISLMVKNSADGPMPAGLGFHPYFESCPDTRFRAVFGGAWLSDESLLPCERVAPDYFGDWRSGAPATRFTLVDHYHDGWTGLAAIERRDRMIELSAAGCDGLHLYMPPGEPYFCAEPVSHMPDALNRYDMPMTILEPGETAAIAMRIAIA